MTRLGNFYLFLFLLIFTINVESKEIHFLDPVIIDQSFSDLSEKQNSPNLMLDSSGYILSYHIAGVDGYNIKTIRLLTEPQFHTTNEYFLFDSSQTPLYPTVRQIGSKSMIYWFNRDIKENNNDTDTTFKQQLMLYNDDMPNDDEFDNSHSFYASDKANNYQPQFIKTNDRVYCEIIKNELFDSRNNKWELFIRSLDFETSDLYQPTLHFSANGKTALFPYGDSLMLVKSWIFCTDTENLNCIQWASGYKVYIIFENKIESIHSLSSKDVSDKNLQPDDVFVRTINGEHLFALRQNNQLMKINFSTMRFEEVLDISLYTNNSYKKIIPVQTIDYCILILIDNDQQGTIMRFDQQFQFIDSVSIPFEGDVTEISDFIYDEPKDMLSYSYATNLDETSQTTRIFLQSILFDKELVLNPPPELPNYFKLSQNYPNPFNPTTTIEYAIPQNGHVVVDIYNMLGQKVSTLYDDIQTAGEHGLDWNANDQSSGIYLVKVSYANQTESIKTMLLK